MENSQEDKSALMIYFWGLMYFQHDSLGLPQNVGILQGAPGHRFTLRVSWNEEEVDVSDYLTEEYRNWTLEVRTTQGISVNRPVTRLTYGAFNRLDNSHNKADYKWIVNFNDLYPEGYTKDESMLLPNINVRTGEFSTLCATVPLRYRRGEEHGYFGCIAEIIGLRLELARGEQLVLRASEGDHYQQNVILLAGYEDAPRSIGFLNLPPDHLRKGAEADDKDGGHKHDALNGHGGDVPTHFQNYYLFVRKPFDERFDFKLGDVEPGTGCDLPTDLEKWVRSPSPYFCGPSGGG